MSFEGGIDGVLQLLNEITPKLSGFHLSWSNKSMDDRYDLQEYLAMVEDSAKPNADLEP
jgi:hypothetical protein